MLVLLSPSKKLELPKNTKTCAYGMPLFSSQTMDLVKQLKAMSAQQLGRLMSLSDDLANLNYTRYQAFSSEFTTENAGQALFTFKGDVYDGLQASRFKANEIDYAQEHLIILSGLYGALRPLDLMQPYRLEMGTKLATRHGKNLYDFWQVTLTDYIKQRMVSEHSRVLINLASNEYAKAVNVKQLGVEVVTANFKEYKKPVYKPLMLYVKRARGMMARFIITQRPTKVEQLKDFCEDGYRFNSALSKKDELVFTRGD